MSQQLVRRVTTLTRDAAGQLVGATAEDVPAQRAVRLDLGEQTYFGFFDHAFSDEDVALQLGAMVRAHNADDPDSHLLFRVISTTRERLHLCVVTRSDG